MSKSNLALVGETSPKDIFERLPVGDIVPNPGNPRKTFNEDLLKELAASISEVGILEPLVVVPDGPGRYRLVIGERRWRAAQIVGMEEVPVLIRHLTAEQEATVMLVENLQRKELDAIEEAMAYQQLLQVHGWKQEDLAKKLSVSQGHIANRVRLLELPAAVQQNISCEIITPTHGRELLAFKDLPEIVIQKAAKHVEEEKSPVRDTPKMVYRAVSEYGRDLARYRECKFDTTECEACRHAVPGSRYHYGDGVPAEKYCLNHSCYDRKTAAVAAANQARVEAAVAKAKEKGQPTLAEISKLSQGSYERLEGRCSIQFDTRECKGCDHRETVLDYDGDATVICVDVACYKKKQMAASKAANKERRSAIAVECEQIAELAKAKAEAAMEDGDGTFAFLTKEQLVYLAAVVLAGVGRDYSREEVGSLHRYLKDIFEIKDDVFKMGYHNIIHGKWSTTRCILEDLDEEQLLRIVFEWPARAGGLQGAAEYLLKGAGSSA